MSRPDTSYRTKSDLIIAINYPDFIVNVIKLSNKCLKKFLSNDVNEELTTKEIFCSKTFFRLVISCRTPYIDDVFPNEFCFCCILSALFHCLVRVSIEKTV